MDTIIVIMQKNNKTGLFEKELESLNINNEQYILNIYAMENEDNQLNIHINLTTEKDVKDWEYNAIYDHYEKEIFKNFDLQIYEKEEFNPTWELILKYPEKEGELKNILNNILLIHKNEIDEIFSLIKSKKEEYEKDYEN